MIDWMDEHFGWVVIAVILLLILLLVWVGINSDRKEAAACARAWGIARTSADSISVIRMCEVKETRTVYIPQTIYVPSR